MHGWERRHVFVPVPSSERVAALSPPNLRNGCDRMACCLRTPFSRLVGVCRAGEDVVDMRHFPARQQMMGINCRYSAPGVLLSISCLTLDLWRHVNQPCLYLLRAFRVNCAIRAINGAQRAETRDCKRDAVLDRKALGVVGRLR